jgi:hypothetical protein
MAIVTTRPFSPQEGKPFTGYFCYVNSGGERSVIEVEEGSPKVEPIELPPGRYSVEWIESGKEPQFDVAIVPDQPEVELKDILSSLKGEPVDQKAVETQVPAPKETVPANEATTPSSDPTVASQPPATEQEVAPGNVSVKRKGSE